MPRIGDPSMEVGARARWEDERSNADDPATLRATASALGVNVNNPTDADRRRVAVAQREAGENIGKVARGGASDEQIHEAILWKEEVESLRAHIEGVPNHVRETAEALGVNHRTPTATDVQRVESAHREAGENLTRISRSGGSDPQIEAAMTWRDNLEELRTHLQKTPVAGESATIRNAAAEGRGTPPVAEATEVTPTDTFYKRQPRVRSYRVS